VRRAHTTISCRAFALTALLIAVCASRAAAGADAIDRPPPLLPLAQWWSVTLEGQVSVGPVSNGSRVYLAYASGSVVALDATDGHEVWRQKKTVTLPMAAAGDLLFISSGDAVEALRADKGTSAWILPRTKTVAPLVATVDSVVVTTDSEIVVVRATSGEVAWRHAAGGVTLTPALEDGRLYTGAVDGRVLALQMTDGAERWESFFPGGITAIAARGGRVYVGTGDKLLYALDGIRKGQPRPPFRLAAQAIGNIAVDDDRVYVASMDNEVRAFDRGNGNQRWIEPLRQRPIFGVAVSGHVVFAPGGNEIKMIVAGGHGGGAGSLALPGDMPPGLAPAILDSPAGAIVFAVTGGLTNEWNLTKFAPAGDTVLVPFAQLPAMPGQPFLTDPELRPLGTVLQTLILDDPPLRPFADLDWPIVLKDPPLVPFTTPPGLQLRPLSPVLPVRRAGRAPGD
jgi:outer membrane protein assembly factor BamB